MLDMISFQSSTKAVIGQANQGGLVDGAMMGGHTFGDVGKVEQAVAQF